VIKVVSEEEYNNWISEQKTFAESFQPAEEGMTEVNQPTGNEISMIEQ